MKLVVQMVAPKTNSLLLLYDDAQSICRKRHGLGFSLASVGVQAQGRTTILRLNYRNTREILSESGTRDDVGISEFVLSEFERGRNPLG